MLHKGQAMKVLIVEDDTVAASHVAEGLKGSGWRADVVEDGIAGLSAALDYTYDAIILDRMLPGLDGLSMLKSLRAAGNSTPVLILTAVGETLDRVEGLRAGADDYLPKPFALSELEARLEAIARRPAGEAATTTTLEIAGLELDLLKRRVTRDGILLELLPKEFALLEELMRADGRVLSRAILLERVWDFHFEPNSIVGERSEARGVGKE